MRTFAVAVAGASAVTVLRTHQTAEAPASSRDVRLGSDAHVPDTAPEPTAVAAVQESAVATGQASTCTACASAVELPSTTETVVAVVPARLPLLRRVIGAVVDGAATVNVVVRASVPVMAADGLPMVALDQVLFEVDQSAHAAGLPVPATTSRSTTTSTSTNAPTIAADRDRTTPVTTSPACR